MNIKTLLAAVRAIVAIGPQIPELIRAAEALFPSGQGRTKLELVRTWLEGAFKLLGAVEVEFGQIWPILEATVERLGAALNIFRGKPDQAAQ